MFLLWSFKSTSKGVSTLSFQVPSDLDRETLQLIILKVSISAQNCCSYKHWNELWAHDHLVSIWCPFVFRSSEVPRFLSWDFHLSLSFTGRTRIANLRNYARKMKDTTDARNIPSISRHQEWNNSISWPTSWPDGSSTPYSLGWIYHPAWAIVSRACGNRLTDGRKLTCSYENSIGQGLLASYSMLILAHPSNQIRLCFRPDVDSEFTGVSEGCGWHRRWLDRVLLMLFVCLKVMRPQHSTWAAISAFPSSTAGTLSSLFTLGFGGGSAFPASTRCSTTRAASPSHNGLTSFGLRGRANLRPWARNCVGMVSGTWNDGGGHKYQEGLKTGKKEKQHAQLPQWTQLGGLRLDFI